MNYPVYETNDREPFLAVPCLRYQVSISMVQEQEKYLLESWITQALGLLGGNISKTAEALCIKEETVTFIASYLRHSAKLDENFMPINSARPLVEAVEEKEWKSFYIFQDALEGRLIPYISEGTENWLSGNVRKDILNAEGGSAGKQKSVSAYLLGNFNSTPPAAPRQREVYGLIQYKYKELFRTSERQSEFSVSIASGSGGERVYLLCPVALQTGDGSILVGQGFQNSYYPHLTNLLKKNRGLLSKYLEDFRTAQDSNSSQKGDSPLSLEKKHANIVNGQINIAESSLDKKNQQKKYGKKFANMFVIYEAILEEHLCGNFTCTEDKISLWPVDKSEAGPYFTGIIKKLGGEIDEDLERFFEISKNDIIRQGFLSGKEKNLGTLPKFCAMSLVSAESEQTHPIRKCLRENPMLFLDMQAVKKIRDPASHGQEEQINIDTDLLDRQIASYKIFLKHMKPSLLDSREESEPEDAENILDSVLDAQYQVNMKVEFLFSDDSDTYKSLVSMEKSMQTSPHDVINCMYNALNFALLEALKELGKNQTNYQGPEIKNKILNRFGELPESLKTVKNNRIEKTLNGGNESLGASLLVVLVCVPIPTEIAKSLINFTDELIQKRGHGEGNNIPNKNDLEKMCEKLYECIKNIFGGYDG